MSRRTNYHYDEPNDEDEDENFNQLRSKVKVLKEVSIQIGEETREHNRFLRELDTRADTVFGSLSLNMDQVKRLARSGNNRVVFYLLAFALFVALVIYLIHRSS